MVRDTELTSCTFGDTNVFFYIPKFDRNRGWMHFCLYMSHCISHVLLFTNLLAAILSPPAFEIPSTWLADPNLSSNREPGYSPQNGIAPTNAWFFPSVWIKAVDLMIAWSAKHIKINEKICDGLFLIASVKSSFHYTSNAMTTTQKQSDYKVEQSSFTLIALFWLEIGNCRGRDWLNENRHKKQEKFLTIKITNT